MKNALFVIFLFSSFISSACSCAPYYSYCEARSLVPYDVIVYGQVLDTNLLNIRIKRFQTIEGIEIRDTITVWNDSNFWCTGTISMKASGIGNPGDSIIVMLPRINVPVNAWEIPGDYRRPSYLCAQSTLKVKNKIVLGTINQTVDNSVIPPVYRFYSNYLVSDFLSFIYSNNDCIMIRDSTLTYIPFPETNAIWIDSTDINSFGKCQEFETKRKKDTLINGVNYQKLVQFHQERFQCSNIITHSNQKTVGFYRNDIANRKVWLRLPNANSDTLLYDFNLQVGDTMPESYLNDLNFGQVKIIDSIRYRLISDRWRRVFYYNGICNGANDVQFLIEGIGKTDGAFKAIEPCFLGAEYTVLGCHSINSTRVFPDSGSICKLVTGIEKQNKEKNLLVFPNPTNGQIFLTLSSDIESLKLYDITGRLILEKGGHEKQLMLPEDKGMYLLHIQLNNGNSILKKLIRN